jgi:hypothetical protein
MTDAIGATRQKLRAAERRIAILEAALQRCADPIPLGSEIKIDYECALRVVNSRQTIAARALDWEPAGGEVPALTMSQRIAVYEDSLRRIANHDLDSPRFQWDDLEIVVRSMRAIAVDAMSESTQ